MKRQPEMKLLLLHFPLKKKMSCFTFEIICRGFVPFWLETNSRTDSSFIHSIPQFVCVCLQLFTTNHSSKKRHRIRDQWKTRKTIFFWVSKKKGGGAKSKWMAGSRFFVWIASLIPRLKEFSFSFCFVLKVWRISQEFSSAGWHFAAPQLLNAEKVKSEKTKNKQT